MRNFLIAAALTLSPLAAPAQTADCPAVLSPATALGTTVQDVESNLKAMGYEIRKSEGDDKKIEVYFVKDKAMGEVYVSPQTGMITKMSYETE